MANARSPLPRIRVKPGALGPVRDVLIRHGISTVCESALCPNRPECYSAGHATVLILGALCTRSCSFCSVPAGSPQPPDPGEPAKVAGLAAELGMRHLVITSVTRDDLEDGGAAHYRAVAEAVAALPGPPSLEALIPDLQGDGEALLIMASSPYRVLAHNVETVPRLYPAVRPQAEYRRSLAVLAGLKAAAPGKIVKSGFMLGLGETPAEVRGVLRDLRSAGVDALSVGQYLRPTPGQRPVERYLPRAEFQELAEEARSLGFRFVHCGPLVRSSYRAGQTAVLFDPVSVPLIR